MTSFKLWCTLSDTNSLQYELKVCFFESGNVEQYILWKCNLKNLIKGQILKMPKFEMMRKVLEGDALAVFNEKAFAKIVEDEDSFRNCLDVCKHKAL